ncbi:Zona pellucida-like domain [Popillia japonica]|uniref:Zona pellucida-like domain n=1 Tax=Popillia japonica TaxID=7064 RepID=A0AAW1MS89_POPJA
MLHEIDTHLINPSTTCAGIESKHLCRSHSRYRYGRTLSTPVLLARVLNRNTYADHIVGTDMDSPERPPSGGHGGIRPGMPPSRPYPPQGDGPGYPYPPSSSGGSGYDYPSRFPPSSGGYDRPERPHPPGRYPSPYDEPNLYDEFRHHGRLPDIIPFPTTPVQVPHRYPDARPPVPGDERYGDYDVPNYRPSYPIGEDRYGPGVTDQETFTSRDIQETDTSRAEIEIDTSQTEIDTRLEIEIDSRLTIDIHLVIDTGLVELSMTDMTLIYHINPIDLDLEIILLLLGMVIAIGLHLPDRESTSGTTEALLEINMVATIGTIPDSLTISLEIDIDRRIDMCRETSIVLAIDSETVIDTILEIRMAMIVIDINYRPGDRFGNGYRYNTGNKNGDDSYRYKFSYYGDDRYGGPNYPFYSNRRPARPLDDRRPARPISPGPDGPIYDDSFDGLGAHRPAYGSRCDGGDNFKQLATKRKIRKDYVVRFLARPSLRDCQLACVESTGFSCRSFNFREGPPVYEDDGDNCELSDRDSRDLDLNNPQFFEPGTSYNYYERSISREADGECLDVSQICNEDGMEFTLRTREGFFGRIYAYGYYDRCFFRGNGGTVNVLRISGSQGYPECGTQRYGDTMTNIVVVQFSDNVQTDRDKRFNLTCLFRGPGEAIVTSSYIGAGSGSPIPIEYLPAENTGIKSSRFKLWKSHTNRVFTGGKYVKLQGQVTHPVSRKTDHHDSRRGSLNVQVRSSSKVRLLILYQGRPTTTIAVGDPLTFKLEAQDGYNYITDIFATNVVARDPYTGRSVQLIDRYGCPVDAYVFPELDRGRNGDTLEANFNAFKIPESNYLIFEANVRTCKDGCQPAYCPSSSGRSEASFGRRRRSLNVTLTNQIQNDTSIEDDGQVSNDTLTITDTEEESESESPEQVRELIEVFESREELQLEARRADPLTESVCITPGEYQGLISAVFALTIILITISLFVGFAYRRYWSVMKKNLRADRASSNISSSYPATRSSGASGISIFGGGFQKPFSNFGRSNNFPALVKDDLDCPEPGQGRFGLSRTGARWSL